MLGSIWDDIRREFSYGNMVTRIIIVNVAVYVLINALYIVLVAGNGGQVPLLYDRIVYFFCVSSNWWYNLTHPWVFITSAFVHEDFRHILWNMLFLMWFGRIVGDFIGNHRVFPIYLLGGLVGACSYLLSSWLLPAGTVGSYAMGASAAVMAFVMAAATISPDYSIRVLLIGDVKLKYIVAVLLFLDFISIAHFDNTGGHFAHLGGALFGWFFIRQLRSGQDLALPVNNLLDAMGNWFRRPVLTVRHNNSRAGRQAGGSGGQAPPRKDPQASSSYQEQLDAILDKIKQTGYDSLSSEEKEFLFKASKQ